MIFNAIKADECIVGCIEALVVSDAYQRKGFGTQMLAHLRCFLRSLTRQDDPTYYLYLLAFLPQNMEITFMEKQ